MPSEHDDVIFSLTLPKGVVVSDALLGSRWEIEVEHGSFALHLPRGRLVKDESSDNDWAELLPPTVHASVDSAIHHLTAHEAEQSVWSFWGGVTSWSRTESRIVLATLDHAVVSCIGPSGTRSAKRDWFEVVGKDLNDWVVRFTGWLEVLSLMDHGDDRPPSVRQNNRLGTALFVNAAGTGGEWVSPTRSPAIQVHFTSDFIATDTWAEAVRNTNASSPVPEAHRYLSRAHVALSRGDRRRAVIDAASGVEIALAQVVQGLLPNSSPTATSTLLKNQRGVVELFDLYAAMSGVELAARSSVMDRIAGPRNLAVHVGREPDARDASRCIELAMQIIKQLVPI